MAKIPITTLKERCFKVLTKNVDNLIVYLDDQRNSDLKKLVRRKWSNDLLQRMERVLQVEHARFFINAHLKELALHLFSSKEFGKILQILKVQGEGILHLSFEAYFFERYTESTVLHLAKSLPSSLTCLQFGNVKCSDAALAIVARNCPNLQKLYLKDCKRVTNYGISALFLKADGSPNIEMRFLDLRGTAVTESGILMALDHCPNMTEIFHSHLNYALNLAYEKCLNSRSQPSKSYNLKTLTIGYSHITPSLYFLRSWQMLCPRVQNLNIRYLETQTELDICKDFQDLKSVSLYSLKPILLSPFLEIRGSELEHLHIFGHTIVFVDSVIKFCPKLVSLSLGTPRFESSVAVETTKYSLQNLLTLEISHMDVEISKRELRTLFLGSPKLEKLTLFHVSGFTDDFVSIIALHDVVSLRSLEVQCCEIDTSILKKIIMAAPLLINVSIELCDNISYMQGKDLELLRDGLAISQTTPVFPFRNLYGQNHDQLHFSS